MVKPFLNTEEQGIVVFKIWQSLKYGKRVLIASSCLIIGIALQIQFLTLLPGIILVFIGALFLLPSGYNNKVKIGKFNPDSDWEKADRNKLDELLAMDKKIRKWDRSTMDVSNPLGFFTFLILLVLLVIIFFYAQLENDSTLTLLSVNGAVLLIPFWFTGLRAKFTIPDLTMKIKLIKRLLSKIETRMEGHQVEFFLLLKGRKEKQIPADIKFRITVSGQDRDFLGFYGQIVTNNVQGTVYPYFYVVLVAKRYFGLKQAYRDYVPTPKFIKEFKAEEDVEVLVIRQNTKIRKGYHTNSKQVLAVFMEGLNIAETAAKKEAI